MAQTSPSAAQLPIHLLIFSSLILISSISSIGTSCIFLETPFIEAVIYHSPLTSSSASSCLRLYSVPLCISEIYNSMISLLNLSHGCSNRAIIRLAFKFNSDAPCRVFTNSLSNPGVKRKYFRYFSSLEQFDSSSSKIFFFLFCS